jgi:RND family efflux transporter MFP subunit
MNSRLFETGAGSAPAPGILARFARPAAWLLGLALLAACGKGEDEAAGKATGASAGTTGSAPSAALAVTLAPVRSQRIERGQLASGPVTPWEEMQLGVELSGLRVTAVHVDVGQQVARGQLLLELDHRTLDSELRQADAVLAEAVAGVNLAQVNLKRGQGLAEAKLISASAFDELRAALVQAQAREATTRAQRDSARLRRDYATLRAPDAGIVSRRNAQPGQVIAAGTELLALIRQGKLEWRPEFPEAELARIHVGDEVRLHDAAGTLVAGRVRAVSPGVDASKRTGTVYAELPEPGALKAGAYVEGRVLTDASPGLVVPTASVVVRDGYPYVFMVDPRSSVAKRLRVRTGERLGGLVEVLDGVKAGDEVVVQGAGFLGDGDHVRVVTTPVAGVKQ